MARTVFIVLIPFDGDSDLVLNKARENLPESDIFEIDSDKLAIAFDGTSRDLAEKIGILGSPTVSSGVTSPVSSGVVFPVSTYSGRADPALWEWLGSKIN